MQDVQFRQIYCVKCKKKTPTAEIKEIISKNNRQMIQGVCEICGKNKSSFKVASTAQGWTSSTRGRTSSTRGRTASGSGFSLNSLVNNLPVELHQFSERGENVPSGSFNDQQKYSYCGLPPGYKV